MDQLQALQQFNVRLVLTLLTLVLCLNKIVYRVHQAITAFRVPQIKKLLVLLSTIAHWVLVLQMKVLVLRARTVLQLA